MFINLDDVREIISNKACGRKYKVKYQTENQSLWIVGTLLNYNSGNLDLITDDNYVIHIPYSGLRWLLPLKDDNKSITEE